MHTDEVPGGRLSGWHEPRGVLRLGEDITLYFATPEAFAEARRRVAFGRDGALANFLAGGPAPLSES